MREFMGVPQSAEGESGIKDVFNGTANEEAAPHWWKDPSASRKHLTISYAVCFLISNFTSIFLSWFSLLVWLHLCFAQLFKRCVFLEATFRVFILVSFTFCYNFLSFFDSCLFFLRPWVALLEHLFKTFYLF